MPERRFPSWRFVGGFAALVLLVVSAFGLCSIKIPSGRDADEASAICRAVNDSGVLPSGADASWRAGVVQSRLSIDGVRDAATQDRLIAIVRATRRRLSVKPVKVEFSDGGEVLRTDVVE